VTSSSGSLKSFAKKSNTFKRRENPDNAVQGRESDGATKGRFKDARARLSSLTDDYEINSSPMVVCALGKKTVGNACPPAGGREAVEGRIVDENWGRAGGGTTRKETSCRLTRVMVWGGWGLKRDLNDLPITKAGIVGALLKRPERQ